MQALQLLIHTNAEERDKVIETYTFTVNYHDLSDGSQSATGLKLDSSSKSVTTVSTASEDLQSLLRSVIDLCEDLPSLPGLFLQYTPLSRY